MTTTEVQDVMGSFVVKLRGLNIPKKKNYAPLPLNEEEKHFGGKLNDINYKITVRKLHYTGLGFFFKTSTDVYILGHVCGMSQYPQLYYRDLEKYQV